MTQRLVVIVAVVVLALCGGLTRTDAQQAILRGLNISPAYEGWEENPDGSFNLVFGYMNYNWEEEIDLPIGPENMMEPANPDQGQPTHFLPRRNRFVFAIRVPKDFGKKELVWTLTSHGKTERAYATLHPAYFIDDVVLTANNSGNIFGTQGNKAPSLTVDGPATKTATVGKPVSFTAIATDDGKPAAKPAPPPSSQRQLTGGATGLRLSWFVYRGVTGTVSFDPPQFEVWEDYRPGANSPWAPRWRTPPLPPNNQWVVRATFNKPGTYVLKALAHDGELSAAKEVVFEVTP